MANRSLDDHYKVLGVPMKAHDASGGTFSTDWQACKGDWIGVALEVVEGGGASPTCNPTVEVTADDGVNLYSLSEDNNSQIPAAMDQIISTGNHMEYWLQPLPEGSVSGWKFRVKFTMGGTLSVFTITARMFNRTTAEELR